MTAPRNRRAEKPSPRRDLGPARRHSAATRGEPTAKAPAEGRPSTTQPGTQPHRQDELAPGGVELMPGLHISAPPSWDAIPSATARCRCGHTGHARGREQVRALIDAYTRHRAACDGTAPETDRRTAA